MKQKTKWFVSALLACVVGFSSVATAADAEPQYKEGVSYEVRTDTLTKHKEIREFFSFWCGHCFALQPVFNKVEESIPEAEFIRNPVNMLGGPMGPESQRAFVIAAHEGVEDIFVKELFSAMHVDGNIPRNHAAMADFMSSIGIPHNKFEQEYSTFLVAGKVSQYDQWCKKVNLDAVPELVINGKYLILMESVKNDKELIDLIKYVMTLDDVPDAPKKQPK